jgi:deleted-in-malignant-brain-tumors protein 1
MLIQVKSNIIMLVGTRMCIDGEVRLFDGENFSQREGRVEMCFNGVWEAVCADGWDEVATNIVCSQLGYSTGNHSGFSH